MLEGVPSGRVWWVFLGVNVRGFGAGWGGVCVREKESVEHVGDVFLNVYLFMNYLLLYTITIYFFLSTDQEWQLECRCVYTLYFMQ